MKKVTKKDLLSLRHTLNNGIIWVRGRIFDFLYAFIQKGRFGGVFPGGILANGGVFASGGVSRGVDWSRGFSRPRSGLKQI